MRHGCNISTSERCELFIITCIIKILRRWYRYSIFFIFCAYLIANRAISRRIRRQIIYNEDSERNFVIPVLFRKHGRERRLSTLEKKIELVYGLYVYRLLFNFSRTFAREIFPFPFLPVLFYAYFIITGVEKSPSYTCGKLK